MLQSSRLSSTTLIILIIALELTGSAAGASRKDVTISLTGSIRQTVSGTILRHVDFETGDYSQNIQRTVGATLISPGLQGNYAVQLTAPPPTQPQIGLWSFDVAEQYPELYYDFLMTIDQGYNVSASAGHWQAIWEENAPYPISGNEHIALMFCNANGVTNNIFLQFYSAYSARGYDLPYTWGLTSAPGTGDNRVYQLFSGTEMPTGRPVHVEIYVKTNMTSGIITVSMDGTVFLEYHGRTQFDPEINTDNGMSTNLIQALFFNYCDSTSSMHSFIFDEIYIGTQPSPYISP